MPQANASAELEIPGEFCESDYFIFSKIGQWICGRIRKSCLAN
jgi:hypothetical protein